MVVYTLEQRWEILRQTDLQKMQILAKKIISSSDRAYFDLVNKQNCRKTRTHTLKSQRTQNESLFGADFRVRGIITRFFFENEQREIVTVNGDRHRAMLNEFLCTEIED